MVIFLRRYLRLTSRMLSFPYLCGMDSNDIRPYAFTGRYSVFRNRIVSDVVLRSTLPGSFNAVRIRALWDTGCSHSIVSSRVAEFLSLEPTGAMRYRSPFGGDVVCDISSAKIYVVLGGTGIELSVGINDMPNSDRDCDITLGLDFITQGDFALTFDGGQLVMSFCYPPMGAPVDFTFLKPRLSASEVCAESRVIDESDAVASQRGKLAILDYFKNCNQENPEI